MTENKQGDIKVLIHKSEKLKDLNNQLYLVVNLDKNKLLELRDEYVEKYNLCTNDEDKEEMIKEWYEFIMELPIYPLKSDNVELITSNSNINIYAFNNNLDSINPLALMISNEITVNKDTKLFLFQDDSKLAISNTPADFFIVEDWIPEYSYDCFGFIPYKNIGPFNLDKNIPLNQFERRSIRYLCENGLNHVMNRTVANDSPVSIEKKHIDKTYIKYNDIKVRITCQTNKLIKNLREICNDLVIKQHIESMTFYSEKLGICGYTTGNENNYCTQCLVFCGKNEFIDKIKEIDND